MNWNAFKRLFHYLGRYKLRLILVMIAAVLSTLFTVLTPAVTGGITSELYDGVASGSFDWETIVWLLVTLIALYLVAQLFAILQSFSMTKLTACVMETLRGDIDRKMHHLKLDYYDSHTQGEILSTITNDVDTVNNALSQNLTQIVTQVVTAVGILVMMFTTSPILAAIAVVMVPGVSAGLSRRYENGSHTLRPAAGTPGTAQRLHRGGVPRAGAGVGVQLHGSSKRGV